MEGKPSRAAPIVTHALKVATYFGNGAEWYYLWNLGQHTYLPC